MNTIIVRTASDEDAIYAAEIATEMYKSAIARGSGISSRSPESLIEKMQKGVAIIALTDDKKWVGFAYLQSWANDEFVSNSGMMVSPAYRGQGIASKIKTAVFDLSRRLYPDAKIFSITTGLAIMKMNTRLGFEPVTYDQLPKDQTFWDGCKSCVNHSILEGKHHSNCLCTAMLFNSGSISNVKDDILYLS